MEKAMELKQLVIQARERKGKTENLSNTISRLVGLCKEQALKGETSIIVNPMVSNISDVIDELVLLGYTVNHWEKNGSVVLDIDWT